MIKKKNLNYYRDKWSSAFDERLNILKEMLRTKDKNSRKFIKLNAEFEMASIEADYYLKKIKEELD